MNKFRGTRAAFQVERVYRQLLEYGMIWTKASVQAALHKLFPDTIAPVFIEKAYPSEAEGKDA